MRYRLPVECQQHGRQNYAADRRRRIRCNLPVAQAYDQGITHQRLVTRKVFHRQEATAVLDAFRSDHNRRFAIPPADATPAWRVVRRGTDLARVCSFHYAATVLNDNTVRLAGLVIDIPPGPRKRSYAGVRIELRQFLDGSWRVYLGDTAIAATAVTSSGELRTLRRRRRRPPSAASVGETAVALRAPSVSPTDMIPSRP